MRVSVFLCKRVWECLCGERVRVHKSMCRTLCLCLWREEEGERERYEEAGERERECVPQNHAVTTSKNT